MSRNLFIKAQIGVLIMLSLSCFVTAQGQDVRQSNNQYGVSFQPPTGWRPDPIAQYVGPKRKDGTAPMLTLLAEDALRDLSDNRIDALAKEVREEIGSEGIESVQIADRQKRTVAGRSALQIDATYKVGDISLRQRRVYVPVSEQNRTYLFLFVDTAQNFDQSAPSADAAIAAFSLNGQNGQGGANAGANSSERKLPLALLIALGLVALAVTVGSGYLLLQKRASAH